ncbi:MAG: AAA family ATPase [Alphaproteobacteria bacterium]|jgi:DNA polymerase-3 subunit delta'
MASKKQNSYNFPEPIDNEQLIGHKSVLQAFNDAWANRDKYPLHPVWILSGTRGIGKATLAYKIAKQVYGNVGDFYILDIANENAIGRDSKAKSISVGLVARMIEKMQLSSMSGGWRVVLIDSLDEMTPNAANAILKMLEEPPEKTLFLLIAHQLNNVLPTIRSRSRIEKLMPLTISQLRDLCAIFLPDEDISTDVLKLANGSFGKIASLKTTGGDEIYQELISVLENSSSNSADMMRTVKKIADKPELRGILLDAIAHFGLANLYPTATIDLANVANINLEPEVAIFKIMNDIKKCL